MSFYKCRERCTAIKICWQLGYFNVLRPMASRIRGRLKTLGFCIGAVGAAAACRPGASQTTTGQIKPDLSNYEDDGSGGGSAWPCMIDDFVEWVVAQ